MEWIVGIIVIAALFYFFVIKRAGNLPFWKVAAAHPMEAMMFFATNPHWHIGQKPRDREVSGPFLFADPRTGQTVKIYGDFDHIEETQAKFMADSKQGFTLLKSQVNSDPHFHEKITRQF